MTDNAVLEPKFVGEIKGKFFIPAYQRGYRWGHDHIIMLLDDILENGDSNYCLQPIVVKKLENESFELIDGQQRLTTVFLIIKYIKKYLPHINQKFTLSFETRNRSEQFLTSLDKDLANDNIDFFHIFNAYQSITTWFDKNGKGDNTSIAIDMYNFFIKKVKVIWYEVNTFEDSTELFTRLNIGKIPLTNAELVKALFLSKDNHGITDEKQIEISSSWDIIEIELQNKDLWAFLTNEPSQKFATRIELLFNMMADKKENEKENFHTFFYFIERMKSEDKIEIWKEIQEYFLILKEWFDKREIYHRVGYLVTIGESLQNIIKESENLTKSAFEAGLDEKIRKSLNLTNEKVLELNYENKNDQAVIEKLLLLFNVETVRLLHDSNEKYPFESHKGRFWSLEHIHAQKSIGLNKKEDQQEWLRLHKASLLKMFCNPAISERKDKVIKSIDENFEYITKAIFDNIFAEVFAILSENEDRSYIDSVSNMALLSVPDNAALNNSTFDVKRNKILEMDKRGAYIPICTRRVFLKYYTDSENHQLNFWGDQDRKAYMDSMTGGGGILSKYLIQPQKAE